MFSFVSRIALEILKRSNLILRSFIIDGGTSADNMARIIRDAREKLDELARKPDVMKKELESRFKKEIDEVIEGKNIVVHL